MDEPRDPSLDAIRESLRQLGYLNTRLDRLILKGAGTRTAWLGGALKVGFLSGIFLALLLLGTLLLIGSPPLTSPREILVLGLYLLVLASVGMVSLELISSLVARLLFRRLRTPRPDARRIARGIGGAGALLAGFYLLLWWRERGGDTGGMALQVAALLCIMGLSLGFGRLTSLSALLSLIRPGSIPGARETTPRPWLPVGLILILLGGVSLVPWGRSLRSTEETSLPEFSIRPPEGRVLWIGMDGLGDRLFQDQARRGNLPFLGEVALQACRVKLDRMPASPPAVWVSAATGMAPSHHGVQTVQAATLRGMQTPVGDTGWTPLFLRAARWMAPRFSPMKAVPVSGAYRRDKMIWEILSGKSIPSYIVNWWATWPAESGPGVRISERAFFKLEAGGPPDREIYPPEDFERLKRALPDFLERHRLPDPQAEASAGPRLPYLLDAYHLERAREGWDQGHWPLVAVYLNGGDLMGGWLEKMAFRRDSLQAAREVEEHLAFLDSRLRELASGLGPNDYLVIEGDPGRVPEEEDPHGFILLRGPGIREGEGAGTVLDVTPTLLRLLGFPLSREMPGHPLAPCLTGSLAAEKGSRVTTFGRRPPTEIPTSDFDVEVLERLRSLGYIQ